jgi:hypothetical protein
MLDHIVKPLTVRRKAAGHIVGFGVTKLDELIARGEIQAVKSGKHLLILVESLENYIASLPRAALKLPPRLRKQQRVARREVASAHGGVEPRQCRGQPSRPRGRRQSSGAGHD